MDRVRFGRALGYGARHAGKAISSALDAATATPTPQTESAHALGKRPETPPPVSKHRAKPPATAHFAPAVKSIKNFSRVVSLQVAGTFYTLFAAALATAVWKQRQWFTHRASPMPQAIYLALPLCALFAYFAVSSFMRANRRQGK